MTPKESARVIKAAGGDKELAELLGMKKDRDRQRVNNWKRRGIPSVVLLRHREVFDRLQKQAAS
jgi:hypothetical protein